MKFCRRFPLVLFLICLPLAALDPGKTLTQYAHNVWSQEEGFEQPTVYAILQARSGFIWFGTQDGLVRFDGVQFRPFGVYENAPFAHTLIRSLAEDNHGNIWIASIGGGVSKLTPDGSIATYGVREGLPSDDVYCAVPDGDDQVWLCTDKGLVRLDHGVPHGFTTRDGLPSDHVRNTCRDAHGTQWIAGLDFPLARFRGGRITPYPPFNLPRGGGTTSLVCSNEGVWAGGEYGLRQITGLDSPLVADPTGLREAVLSLTQSTDGTLWIGTRDGISRYSEGKLTSYHSSQGLSHSGVLSLFLDREGSLWAGTRNGLDQFSAGNVTPYTTSEGLVSNDVGPVLEDTAGQLWIGTLNSGLNIFDGHRFRTITKTDGLLDNQVFSLTLDSEGDVWAGTARGINRIHQGRVAAAFASRAPVNSLFADSTGTVWAGTPQGIQAFDGTRFVNKLSPPGKKVTGVVSLAGGRIVRLFVGSGDGTIYYLKDGVLESAQPAGLNRPVTSYYFDGIRHVAWMGTLGAGLLRWQGGSFTRLRIRDGLYDNCIYSILGDNQGNLWMASSKGIFRVAEDELEAFASGRFHRFASMPFSTGSLRFECRSGVQPAATRTHDGRLWFSTTGGLVVVDPQHLVRSATPPPTQVTAMIVNGQTLPLATQAKLKPGQKNLEFRYAGLSFLSPEKVTFRYILKGFDKNWTDAGTRREAFFTNLPPGHFEFQVMARSADGVWTKQAASLQFEIEPRLYQQLWFWPLIVILSGLAATAVYRVRIRHLQRRFDLVLAERSRIARELHDTLLQGLSGITMQLQAVWRRLPASGEKDFLREVIEDAGICSTEARQSLWGLRAGKGEAVSFSGHLIELARKAVSRRPVELKLDVERVSLNRFPDAEFQLLRITQEAISNVLRHAAAGTLEVSLHMTGKRLTLIIRDDGRGFEADLNDTPFAHYGLVGMRERAGQIGANLSVTSAPGQGTTVTVTLHIAAGGPSSGDESELLIQNDKR